MIKSNHKLPVVKFFDWYITKILKSDFHKIKFDPGFPVPADRSVLLIGNHFSWWDGFFAYLLNLKLFKRKFNVMMLEKELSKRMLFSYAGAFSIAPGSASVNESLDYTCRLLNDPGNLVLIFPQGKIQSQYQDSFKFGWGPEYILNRQGKAQLVFYAAFSDYFSQRKPTLTIFCKTVTNPGNPEAEYNNFYTDCRREYLERNNG